MESCTILLLFTPHHANWWFVPLRETSVFCFLCHGRYGIYGTIPYHTTILSYIAAHASIIAFFKAPKKTHIIDTLLHRDDDDILPPIIQNRRPHSPSHNRHRVTMRCRLRSYSPPPRNGRRSEQVPNVSTNLLLPSSSTREE